VEAAEAQRDALDALPALAARIWPSDAAMASMIAWMSRLRSRPIGSSTVRGRSYGPKP
jgi:hypothetical protein